MTEGAGCDIIFKETSVKGKGNEKYMIYEIADLRIQIKNRCSFTTEFCKGYLAADQAQPPDLSAAASEQAFSEEKKSCPGYSDGYIENICIYRDLCLRLPRLERFLLHAAVLDYKGEGYAFLGRSGAGKSTHTGLWLKYLPKAKILNGDKPIVARAESGFYAYGTPWMGKEGRGEKGIEGALLSRTGKGKFSRPTVGRRGGFPYFYAAFASDRRGKRGQNAGAGGRADFGRARVSLEMHDFGGSGEAVLRGADGQTLRAGNLIKTEG